MKLAIGLTYLLYLLLLFFYEYKKTNDLFHPLVFFTILQIIEYPYAIICKKSESYAYFTLDNIIQLIICNVLYTIVYFLFYYFFDRTRLFKNRKNIELENNENISTLIIIFIFLIGAFSKIYTFYKIGGIIRIISDPSIAYLSQASGFGYVSLLSKMMLVAILLMLDKYLIQKRKMYLFYTVLMSIYYMSSYLIFSSRGPALELIIIIVFVINYKVKKFNIMRFFKPKYLMVFLCVGLIAMSALSYRTQNKNTNIVTGLFDEYSRVGRDIYTYQYFDSHELFYGRSIYNVIFAFLPSNKFKNKPIVDDGLFLINVMTGHYADINSSYRELFYKSGSIPFTTQGMMYANFSYFGLFLAGFIMAFFQYYFYNRWALSNNILNIGLYFYGVYMFGLTPLYLVNVIQIIIIFKFINILLKRRKIKE